MSRKPTGRPPGRPAIGPQARTALETWALEEVDRIAQERRICRSKAIRLLVHEALAVRKYRSERGMRGAA